MEEIKTAREFKTTDIDLATHLVLEGYTNYKLIKNPTGFVTIVFNGEDIEQKVREFPNSITNKVLSTYFGLKKIVRLANK
jgi:hypothetical protein